MSAGPWITGILPPHVVGPDVGTSAALFAAASAPDRFRSLTVGTGGAAVPLQLGGVLAYPTDLPVLRDLLPGIQTPVHVINGRRDGVVPPANAEYLRQRLPRCQVDLIDAGHFIWKDAAEDYATLVLDWRGGGYLNPIEQSVHD